MIMLYKPSEKYVNPEFEIFLDPKLMFTIRSYSYTLPPSHFLYINYERSCSIVTFLVLIKEILKLNMCKGVGTFGLNVVPHVVQNIFDISNPAPLQQDVS